MPKLYHDCMSVALSKSITVVVRLAVSARIFRFIQVHVLFASSGIIQEATRTHRPGDMVAYIHNDSTVYAACAIGVPVAYAIHAAPLAYDYVDVFFERNIQKLILLFGLDHARSLRS